jgi:hypothetical protein
MEKVAVKDSRCRRRPWFLDGNDITQASARRTKPDRHTGTQSGGNNRARDSFYRDRPLK